MKMNPETTQAWEECKIHWDKIADGDQNEPVGESSCAFCTRFVTPRCTEPDTEERCPIYRATGHNGCSGTPYSAAEEEHFLDDEETTEREMMRDFIYNLPNVEDNRNE